MVVLLVGNRWSDGLYYKEPVQLNGAVLEVHADYSSYLYVVSEPGVQALSATWTGRSGPWSHATRIRLCCQ